MAPWAMAYELCIEFFVNYIQYIVSFMAAPIHNKTELCEWLWIENLYSRLKNFFAENIYCAPRCTQAHRRVNRTACTAHNQYFHIYTLCSVCVQCAPESNVESSLMIPIAICALQSSQPKRKFEYQFEWWYPFILEYWGVPQKEISFG